VTVQLQQAPDGLRAQLTERQWTVLAAGRDPAPTGALAPLQTDAAADAVEGEDDGEAADEPLAAAAALALGDAPMRIELLTGAGDRGLVAQIGCDAVATGIAVRALVPAEDGSGPVAVPGVEVGANQTANVVAEIMRLFPGGGLTRHADADPVTLPHDLSLTLHHAIRSHDDALAQHVAEQAGFDAPPDVLVSLARATTASATLTARVTGSRTTVVQQWLLCDVGWVLMTVRGTRVTHTAQSRDEVRDAIMRIVAGGFAAMATAGVTDRG
jgi:hypothetical protein